MDRIINILKPPNMTSHDVVGRLRRVTKIKKIGHTGTLDPMAAGVLPVCIGKSTKIIEYFEEDSKTYRCEMTLGASTDTEDAWGTVLETSDHLPTEQSVIDTMMSFIGDIEQVPPMYSALKINGQKLYDLARQGKVVERKARLRTIHTIDIIHMDLSKKTVIFDVCCSKGTYVRTLCHDIGLKLGCLAHMSFLMRTASGNFTLADAVTLEEVQTLQAVLEKSRSIEEVLAYFGRVSVPTGLREKMINGVKIDLRPYIESDGNFYRVYVGDLFLGTAKMTKEGLFVDKYLYDQHGKS
ncbi:MAG: tRNA pseudouridine(55) synthase TruB [Clostridia bacterium]|nr:tRNA pseudouridine(55) synthase TruB [Clostridia bacterium]